MFEEKKSNFDLNKEVEYKMSGKEGSQNEDDAAEAPDENLTFFNVMPKAETQEKIIEPSLKINPPKVESQNQNVQPQIKPAGFFKKYKLYVILAALLLIGGPLAYFGTDKLFNKPPAEDENLLLEPGPDSKPESQAPAANGNTDQNQAALASKEWQLKHWGKEVCEDENLCGNKADPDLDGLANLEEFKIGADPNNKDSDGDGLADGDEVNIFATDPLNARTANDPKYGDNDYIIGGYDTKTLDKKLTPEQLDGITIKMREFGLHQPTLKTLGLQVLDKIYHFNPSPGDEGDKTATSTPPSLATSTPGSNLPAGIDGSIEAQTDRDAQRSDTIKKIEAALVGYFADNKFYPKSKNFQEMYAAVKPYLTVATNPQDPVNQEPFIYSYEPTADGSDFTLSFYSEVAKQAIKKKAADAQKDVAAKQAGFNDDLRKQDLENLKIALLLYSQKQAAGEQEYAFPTESDYKKSLVPNYITQIPKDPKTGQDYEYKVSETFDTFTLKTVLENPKTGTTGYLCNQEECREY